MTCYVCVQLINYIYIYIYIIICICFVSNKVLLKVKFKIKMIFLSFILQRINLKNVISDLHNNKIIIRFTSLNFLCCSAVSEGLICSIHHWFHITEQSRVNLLCSSY